MTAEKSGEITVFLSLILTCICALMCGLLESARVAGSGWYLQMAADSALDSLMSKYHRDVWEDYHLLVLEFEDEEGLEDEIRPYLSSYLEGETAYGLGGSEILAAAPVRITDRDGACLEQEILDYMRLGIWTMERDPAKLQTLADDMKEADSLGGITGRYQSDTENVMKLEKALEKIGDSLRAQKQYLEKGRSRLRSCDGSGFIREAGKLKKELQKMPSLIAKYEKEADSLAAQYAQSELLAKEKSGDLQPDTWQMVSDSLDGCRSYTDREGERRREVKAVGQRAAENLSVVEAAIREAEETLEYIDSWEPDDEDDELDEEPLWEAVMRVVNRFKEDSSFAEPTIKDKKKMNLIENISRLAQGDLLSLVVPEDRGVSGALTDTHSFPSGTAGGSAGGGFGIGDLVDMAFINEYAGYHFTNYCSPPEKQRDKTLQYEQEYILQGKASDRENLKMTVNGLIKVREAMNLIYLYRDSEKRGEAKALAAAITGVAGLSPLTEVVAFFILTVWAFAESLEDVKTLLSGGRVPFVKRAEEWKLSLSRLLEWGGSGGNGPGTDGDASGRGLDYQAYLKLFLMLQNRVEKDYRMMDMIQENVNRKQRGFLMAQCAYQVEVECRAKGRYVSLKRKAVKAY